MSEQQSEVLGIQSFVGNDVDITYETTTTTTISGTVVGHVQGAVIVQYESRKKLYTELIPFTNIKGMAMSEAVAEEENPEGAEPEAAV